MRTISTVAKSNWEIAIMRHGASGQIIKAGAKYGRSQREQLRSPYTRSLMECPGCIFSSMCHITLNPFSQAHSKRETTSPSSIGEYRARPGAKYAASQEIYPARLPGSACARRSLPRCLENLSRLGQLPVCPWSLSRRSEPGSGMWNALYYVY
jgi:hypothetical protein